MKTSSNFSGINAWECGSYGRYMFSFVKKKTQTIFQGVVHFTFPSYFISEEPSSVMYVPIILYIWRNIICDVRGQHIAFFKTCIVWKMRYFIGSRSISNLDTKANTKIWIRNFVTKPTTQKVIFLPVTPWQHTFTFTLSCNRLYQPPRLWAFPYFSKLCHLLMGGT